METFISFVQQWGYLAVFFGSLVEGESVILTASAMASMGYLSITKIALIAFTGTLIADQTLYLVGWYYGPSIFDRFPRVKTRAERAFKLLHRYDIAFIIACRFIYGIRTTSPVVIGAAGVKPSRFIPLNFLSALIWTVVSCTGGYYLGEAMMHVFEYFHIFQKIIIALVIVCFIAFLAYKFNQKRNRS